MVSRERIHVMIQVAQQSVHDSIESFKAHRMRTVLTSLGVIFGVAAVIAMLAITEGAKIDAIAAIERLGLRNIFVIKWSDPKSNQNDNEENLLKKLNPDGLTIADGEAIQQIVPQVGLVVPSIRKTRKILGPHSMQVLTVVGTTREYFAATNRDIRAGRLLHELDEVDAARVAVLGSQSAKDLFPTETALGKFIKLRGEPYRIVGVLGTSGGSMNISDLPDWDPDKEVFVPLSTASRYLTNDGNRAGIEVLLIQMEDESVISQGGKLIQTVLNRRHRNAPDFKVVIPEELLAQSQRTQRTFTIIMAAIAGISLLVGGIGIMNIMLSSVLERTHEIGIRRAIGATQKEISRQFLTEAALLSGGGGIIGMVLGIGLAYLVPITAGWVTVITVWSVVLSLGVAVAVGIIFGLFPAKQAAKLDPIEALRYTG